MSSRKTFVDFSMCHSSCVGFLHVQQMWSALCRYRRPTESSQQTAAVKKVLHRHRWRRILPTFYPFSFLPPSPQKQTLPPGNF